MVIEIRLDRNRNQMINNDNNNRISKRNRSRVRNSNGNILLIKFLIIHIFFIEYRSRTI